jgi:lysophospholipase L1-like esterase
MLPPAGRGEGAAGGRTVVVVSRATRARRVAAAAAYGGGGVTAVGLGGYALIRVQALLARRAIGTALGRTAPAAPERYGAGVGDDLRVLVLGDSSAAGLGAQTPEQTPAAIIATGLSAISGQAVRLANVARVGAVSADLDRQVGEALARLPEPDLALVLVGANDVTRRVRPAVAVRELAAAVSRLRAAGAEVVVGTCPDFGAVRPIGRPLRHLARRLSRDLAAAQTVAVVEAGGRTVSLGDLLGHDFVERHAEMFSADLFHPSPAGYARIAAVLLPTAVAALGLWPQPPSPSGPRPVGPPPREPARVAPLLEAAATAVRQPGTEVGPARVAGADRGPAGRWSHVLRRRRQPPAGAPAGALAPVQPSPEREP